MGRSLRPATSPDAIVLWWSAFTAFTGLASNYWLLLAIRFSFGAGEAGAYPNIAASISRWFPRVERAQALGIVLMASQIGGALTPLVVVPIQATYGWRVSFYVFGSFGVMWAAAWYWYYRDTPSEMPGVPQSEIEEVGSAPPQRHAPLPWGLRFTARTFGASCCGRWRYYDAGYFFSHGFRRTWSKGVASASAARVVHSAVRAGCGWEPRRRLRERRAGA